jgi:hypothetical protein
LLSSSIQRTFLQYIARSKQFYIARDFKHGAVGGLLRRHHQPGDAFLNFLTCPLRVTLQQFAKSLRLFSQERSNLFISERWKFGRWFRAQSFFNLSEPLFSLSELR